MAADKSTGAKDTKDTKVTKKASEAKETVQDKGAKSADLKGAKSADPKGAKSADPKGAKSADLKGAKSADLKGAKSAGTKSASSKDAKKSGDTRDFSYTQNREISWLRFDDRVLDEAADTTVPLFERLKFASIFGSNLDEWFMIRIGGLSDLTLLKHQPRDNKSNQTPAEQLQTIFAVLPGYISRQERILSDIESQLASHGLARIATSNLTNADKTSIDRYFDASIAPIISPQIVDPRHPFPNLRNMRLYVTCSLDGPDEIGMLGIVEVPRSLPRVVELPSTMNVYRYILIEDIIRQRLPGLFGSYVPTASATIRITRNADIDPDGEGVGEEEDYRQHMKRVLKLRQRLQPVRLEAQGRLPKELERFVLGELGLSKKRIFHVSMPLDLGYVYSLEAKLPADSRATLLYNPFSPQPSPMVSPTRPMRGQVEAGDILLFYPYESMDPLLRLIHEASADDDCIQIKITLYRVAKLSKLCESLVAASENGKEVTVLMELRARFDEANNIIWAERLEDAGCTVIYGQEGYKVHSKICQITYHNKGAISRITCLGTGNFNEKTAGLYSDFMLLTAHTGIGEDGNVFFRNLSLGNLEGSYHYLGVAPASLKPLVMSGLDREIARARAGQEARVFLKMNSLTDRDVIDKIAEACEAHVHITMIVRGICCIKAGVAGKTDGLIVRQIVGRFLEHARVYAFGVDSDTIYLSSADMMTRNTERRVEIAYPVLDPTCRTLVRGYMDLQLADNTKARQLTSKGTWEKIPIPEGEPLVNAQNQLCALATERARQAQDAATTARRRIKYASPTGPSVHEISKADTAEEVGAGAAPVAGAVAAPVAGAVVAPEAPVTSKPTSTPKTVAAATTTSKSPTPVTDEAIGEVTSDSRIKEAIGLISSGLRILFGKR